MRLSHASVFVVLWTLLVFSLAGAAHAAGIDFVVARGDTGGTIGNLNTVGDDLCPNASVNGCDFSKDDNLVRSNDGVEYRFAVEVDGVGDTVYIEAELDPGMVWDQIPGTCNPVTSTITGDGSPGNPSRIFCDLGFRRSFAADITFVARALGSVPNGSLAGLSSASFYGDDSSAIVYDAGPAFDDVTISSKPQYNLRKGIYQGLPYSHLGVDGYRLRYRYYIETWKTNTNGNATDDPNPAFGLEAPSGPVSFVEDVSSVSPNAYILGCPTASGAGSFPYRTYNAANPEQSVSNAGTPSCPGTGAPGDRVATITITGADLSLGHYPTQTQNGTAISGDLRIGSMGLVDVFIPLADITAADGELATTNVYQDLSLTSISGQSNFQGAPQDGSGEVSSDNSYSRIVQEGNGSFSHTYRCEHPNGPSLGCERWWYAPTSGSAVWAGDGAIEPTQRVATYTYFRNNRLTEVDDAAVCAVFDTRYYTPIPFNGTDATNCAGCGTRNVDYVIEYGVGYVDPSFRDAGSVPDTAIAAECSAPASNWYSTLAAADAAGGTSKVRVRRLTPMAAGEDLPVRTFLQARSVAELAGVPSSTLVKTWGTATSSRDWPEWRDCSYSSGSHPTPLHSTSGCGDRVFLNRALVRVSKFTVPDNVVNTIDAGGRVTFELRPTFTSKNPITDVVSIVDQLPAGGVYVAGSSTVGGVLTEPTITGDVATGEVLTWDLGTRTANDPLPVIEFDMRTPLTTPNGTTLNNLVTANASADDSSVEQRSSERQVIVTAPASMLMSKLVDQASISQDGSVNYTIQYVNTTGFAFNEMDMIDVLPFPSDGRFPPSDYSGTVSLVSVNAQSSNRQFYFTADAPGGIDPDPNLAAANDLSTGSINWCPATAAGGLNPGASPTNGGASSLCPSTLAQVTAVRIVDTEPLDPSSLREWGLTMSTNANFGADRYSNTAKGTSDGITLSPETPTVETVVIEEPSLGAAKTDFDVTDDVVTFRITVENLGNTPFSGVSVIDDLDAVFGAGTYEMSAAPSFVTADPAGTLVLNGGFTGTGAATDLLDPSSVLEPFEAAVISFAVRVLEVTDQGDGVGNYTNQVTVSGTTPGGVVVTDLSDDGTDPDPDGSGNGDDADEDDPTPFSMSPTPTLEVVKTSDGSGITVPVAEVGDLIDYTFEITNTGNVELTGVTLTDPLFDPSDITSSCAFAGAAGVIPFEGSVTCTISYPITQDDIDNAGVTNTAVASADGGATDDSDSGNDYDETGADDDPTTTPIYAPAVELIKTDTPNFGTPVQPGDTITYTFTVANTGNTELTNLSFTDTLSNADGDVQSYDVPGIEWQSSSAGSPAGTLQPDETATYEATYSLVVEDINSGEISNQAVVTADNGSGVPISDMSDDPDDATDTLDDGNPADPTLTPLVGAPGISVVKSVQTVLDTNANNLFGDTGDQILYTFLVTNTGNVTLTDIAVTDLNPDVAVSGGPITLDAGEADSSTFTGLYEITSTDSINMYVQNSATVEGTDPTDTVVDDISDAGTVSEPSDGGTGTDIVTVEDPEDVETEDASGGTDGDTTNDPTVIIIPTNPQPGVILVKSIASVTDTNGNDVTDVGDVVNYTFLVTNTGNVILANVTVDDPMITINEPPLARLDPLDPTAAPPNNTAVFTGSHELTPDDIAAGGVQNQATVEGEAVSDAGTPIFQPGTTEPLLAEDVSDSGTEPELGASGPVTIGSPGGTESPGLDGSTDDDPGNDPTVLLIPAPGISIIKTFVEATDDNGDGLNGGIGDRLFYAFTVTNTGNTRLTNVTVDDQIATVTGGPITLEIGGSDSTTFLAEYAVQPTNIDDGYVENSATVEGTASDAYGDPLYGPTGQPIIVEDISDTGTDSSGDPITNPEGTETPDGENGTDDDPTNDPTIVPVPQNPVAGIVIVKSAVGTEDTNGDAVEGGFDDLMTYQFDVTNTGNYPLSGVEIDDQILGGVIATIPTIAVGDTVTVTYDYLLTYDDFVAGYVQNSATASGDLVTPSGGPLIDPATGQPLSAEDVSDTGTNPDLSDVTDPAGTETPDYDGDTDSDPTNDPTVTTIPITPSNAGVSGIVFLDGDASGGYGSTYDTLLAGIEVTLYNAAGQAVGTAITDANGFYDISGFPVGNDYRLEFVDPASGEVVSEITGLDFGPNTVLTDQNAIIEVTDPPLILINKTSAQSTVTLGGTVNWTIEVLNNGAGPAVNISVVDTLPAGLAYIPGTSTVNGTALEPTVAGQSLTYSGITLPAGVSTEITLSSRVLANAPAGGLTNTVRAIDPETGEVIGTGAATVDRMPEAVFDCTDVIGRVFDDKNYNGYQDNVPAMARNTERRALDPRTGRLVGGADGVYLEPGMPGVRVVTATGTIITTDEHGRFSVPCAALAGSTGSNFTLKLDPRSLPTGYRLTTENPRTMRLTSGIITEMNFGVAIGRIIDIDLTENAFDDAEPKEALRRGLLGLLGKVKDTPAFIRLSYYSNGEDRALIKQRIEEVEDLIFDEWRDIGRYRLIIERTIALFN